MIGSDKERVERGLVVGGRKRSRDYLDDDDVHDNAAVEAGGSKTTAITISHGEAVKSEVISVEGDGDSSAVRRTTPRLGVAALTSFTTSGPRSLRGSRRFSRQVRCKLHTTTNGRGLGLGDGQGGFTLLLLLWLCFCS